MDISLLDETSDADTSFFQVPGSPIAYNSVISFGDSGLHSPLTPVSFSSSSIGSTTRKRKEEGSDPFTPAKRNVAFSSTASTVQLRPSPSPAASVRKDCSRNTEDYPVQAKKDVKVCDKPALKKVEEKDNTQSSDFLAFMEKKMEANSKEMMISVRALGACHNKGDQLINKTEDILKQVNAYKEDLRKKKEIVSRMNQVSGLISRTKMMFGNKQYLLNIHCHTY